MTVAVLLAFATAARAADDPTDAENLFEDARVEMRRGNFGVAREKLVQSLQLEETVGTLFNLSLCEEKLGLLRSSLEHLRAARARAGEDDRRRPIMNDLIGSLERRVGRVVLKRASDSPGGIELAFDGVPVQGPLDKREFLADPGTHEIVVRGPGAPPRATTIQVGEGETIEHIVDWQPAPAIALPNAPPPTIESASRPPAVRPGTAQRLGAVAITAGGAALIGGAILGFMTWGSKITVDHHCTDAGCDAEGIRQSESGASYGTGSTALTLVGLASLGFGTYSLLREPAPEGRARQREKSVGYFAGSVGAAALAASAIAGGVALSAKKEVLDRCGDNGPCDDPRGLDAAARGRTATTISSVAFGVGVVGLGVASYSLLLRPRFARTADVRLTLSPSAVGCVATF